MKAKGRLFNSRLAGSSAVAFLVALSLTGCTFGPKFETPEMDLAPEWREAEGQQFVGVHPDNVQWWQNLNDPVLNSLIERAFEENKTLQAASLRIVQARLARTAATFSYLPLITGKASASHTDFSTNVKPEVEIDKPGRTPRRSGPIIDPIRNAIQTEIAASLPTVSVTPEIDIYDAGFDAIWEIDIWGKKRLLNRATSQQLKATYASYDDTLVTLAAEVARLYVTIRALEQRREALNRTLETMNKFVSMTKTRFDAGESPETDFRLASLLAGIVESSIPEIESATRQYENALCVLLGMTPQDLQGELGATGAIPEAPLEMAVGIPADVLRRRPDVRMAEHMAAAECARVGMAKASIMPSFSLFGALGLRSSDTDNFFESDSVRSAYGIMGSITNLINYPITVQNVRMHDAKFQQALLQYQETVLMANMEVENSMYAFLKSKDKSEILSENVENARITAEMTMAAYEEGKVIVSIPLVALSFLSSQEDQYIANEGQATVDYIALYKALGGGWETRVTEELVPEKIQEEMKKQADWWSFTGRHDMKTIQQKN